MVWCSLPAQTNASLVLKMVYKNYKWYNPNDTNDKVIRYEFANNVNNQSGYLKVSAGVVYKNEGVNHSQPYMECHSDTLRNGFIECSTVWMGTGRFSADTMIISFGVKPSSGTSYAMICKYKKL